MDWLTLPHPWDSVSGSEEASKDAESREDHPHLSEFKSVSCCNASANDQLGKEIFHPYHFKYNLPRGDEPVPQGNVRVQVCRSAADWSHGILVEDSIQRTSYRTSRVLTVQRRTSR